MIVEVPDNELVKMVRTVAGSKSGEAMSLPMPGRLESVPIPPEATRQGVTGDVYDAYRRGLSSACADVVLVQVKDGVPKVPLIRRARPPFGGYWWIMGGGIFTLRPIDHVLL